MAWKVDVNERAVVLAAPFSVADAERPTMTFADGSLVVQFVDWTERVVRVTFAKAVAFTWQEEERLPADGERFDAVHRVLDSEWLQEEHLRGVAWCECEFDHLRLCFNSSGVLDVLCTAFHSTIVA